MSINVAIDGPAGAGKSTIARLLAKELGYVYVDTGAMYRAVTLYMLENGIDISSEKSLADACSNIDISISYENGVQCVYLNGENVNGRIRSEEVSATTSRVSAVPAVRAKLLDLQRQLAASENVIMDGRDIGTNVLPNADVKIFLTADSHVRALRRYKELLEKGTNADLGDVEKEITERDERDMNRTVAPLKQADDAVLVDTSDLDIQQVADRLRNIVLERTDKQK